MVKSIPEFNASTAQPANKSIHKFPVANIMLVMAVTAFVLSVSYWIHTQTILTQTQALAEPEIKTATAADIPANSYPKAYKGQPIPEALYADATTSEGVPFVNRQIMKYYLFGEISTDNGMGEPPPVGTFAELNQAVESMELQINKYFSSSDFGYIYLRFSGGKNDQTLKAKYERPDEKAKEIITRYQQLFVIGELSPEQIIEATKSDEELLLFTDEVKSDFKKNYTAADSLFKEDLTFNRFLFSQTANQVSDIHTVKNETSELGYVIVFPTKITKLAYDSVDEMLQEREANFTY